MRTCLIIFLLFLSLYNHSCTTQSSAIKIKTVRIEDIDVSRVLNGNSEIKDLYAEWYGGTIDICYNPVNIAGPPLRLSYSAEDDYAYIYQAPNALTATGSIISAPDNSEMTWDEISSIENLKTIDLVFSVWTDIEDKKYHNMVFIPGGTFRMGSKFNKDEKPKHNVTIDGFYLDKYEVTVKEYRAFCKATRRRMPKQPYWNNETHPVVNVNWADANAYAKWKGKRLPTEAEWEYAARVGNRRFYYAWGNVKPARRRGGNIADESILAEKRNWKIWKGYNDGFVYTSPVGSFNPNQFGLYDMTGNVCEWCADWYQADYYKNSPQINPKGPKKGTHKVLRSGAWNMGPRKVLTTKRFYFRPDVVLNYIGFRCARD
jgi:formylglycine-generating enzyme required for sulfatase activity